MDFKHLKKSFKKDYKEIAKFKDITNSKYLERIAKAICHLCDIPCHAITACRKNCEGIISGEELRTYILDVYDPCMLSILDVHTPGIALKDVFSKGKFFKSTLFKTFDRVMTSVGAYPYIGVLVKGIGDCILCVESGIERDVGSARIVLPSPPGINNLNLIPLGVFINEKGK